jgi:hypothetical protein
MRQALPIGIILMVISELFAAFRVVENRALSSSPRVVQEDLAVDLPDDRDELTTRSDPRLTQLRSHVYAQIQQAKRGGQPGQLTAGR